MDVRSIKMCAIASLIGVVTIAPSVHAKDFKILIDPQTASPAGTPVTFGMAFAEGDLPYTQGLTARVSAGGSTRTVPVQLDLKASHCSDSGWEFSSKNDCPTNQRSVRHAVVSTVLPDAIGTGGRAEIVLTPSASTSGTAGSPIAFPADLDVQTIIVGEFGSFVADLPTISGAASIPEAGTSDATVSEWLSGDIVREWVIRVPFVPSAGGVGHPHLVARYNVRHYPDTDKTRVDVVIENNWTFVPEVASYDYAVAIRINGALRYEETALTHFTQARWKVTLWDEPLPDLHIRHDPYQLMEARVAPNYDSDLVYSLDNSLKEKYATLWNNYAPSVSGGVMRHTGKTDICLTAPNSSYSAHCTDPTAYKITVNGVGPMGIGVVPARFMPQTGGRVEIAPLPQWTSSWVLEQSYPLYRMMLGIADGSGSWPVHFRDEGTDLPLSTGDHPTVLVRNSPDTRPNNTEGCNRGLGCLKPYLPDTAHQASFAFVPYVVTGDYYYLEEVQFWASFNSARMAVEYRGEDRGLFENGAQLRGAAWGLRNLAHAAWVTPDSHALKSHLLFMLSSNLDTYNALYIDNPARRVEYGAAIEYTPDISAPWMDDYFTWSVGNLVDLGYDSYLPLARWKGRFQVARMGFAPRAEDEFCWIFATAYRYRVRPFDPADPVPTISLTRGLNTIPRERIFLRNLADVFRYSIKAFIEGVGLGSGAFNTREACASEAQASEQGLLANQMVGYPTSTQGFVSQLGPALASAVNAGTQNAAAAWERYANRATPANFRTSPNWAIVPRDLSGGTVVATPPDPVDPVGGECRVRPTP